MNDPALATPLERARRKSFRRLMPVLFISYLIAYVDRNNVAVAKLNMKADLPWFDDAVFGLGAGMFFFGYLLLEIPGTLMVERWSARKWICRIMVSWGLMAGLTAAVTTPLQFYGVRFLLGLAEAGFFPGVIVYLTHWFTAKDRSKALSYFLIATPFAQMLNPKISNLMLPIGTTETVNGVTVVHPEVLGLEGWQWVYIAWAIPAVVLGVAVLWLLTDRPGQAKWLTPEEREALESELAKEKAERKSGSKHMTVFEALSHPKVLLLALAYFGAVTASYGIEFFMPSIIKDWYHLDLNTLTWFIILPPAVALAAQLGVGWSSDHHRERRFHAVVPILLGAGALALLPATQGNFPLTLICFMVAFGGFKGYMPAFWALPSLFLTEAAAAGSIGLINSVGNIGGFVGPTVMGFVKTSTGSYSASLYFLCGSMLVTAGILFSLGLGRKSETPAGQTESA
jgi:ACS family tartrate transporter-like MFS transporter